VEVKDAMRYRDTLLFAATGWDPTWARRLSARARAVWATAVALQSAMFSAAAFLAWLHLPRDRRWIPLTLAGAWLVIVGVVQVLVRREVLRRIDVEEDQIAARHIQARLLPTELPRAPGFDLAARYSPFREIGGDFYDVAPLDDHRWLIAMADVSGKGTGAALLTASVQALVHFAYANEPSLEAAAAAINKHLVRFAPPGRFVTMVLGVLDIERRQLRYINAGHNPPLAVTPTGDVLHLAATGLPLGIFDLATYTAAEVDLPAGTTCVLYTDGLVERANPADEFFGEDRVVATIGKLPDGASAAEILAAIATDTDRFARGVEPADDIAVLVVRSC
jgi:sigma-B regulation protein RsbU (phosphoserine phosphatase)